MVTRQRSVQEFWNDVARTHEDVSKQVRESKEQPQDGTCFIVAVRRAGSRVEYGQIMTASTRMAATRIEEGTVVLATDDQVNAFKQHEDTKARKRRADAIDARTTFIAQPPVAQALPMESAPVNAPAPSTLAPIHPPVRNPQKED